jgi:hypothetical protein
MSGFVEKLFDSFTGQNDDQSQQQSQQQQQQQLPPGWTSQWDDREQRYLYINESTGERSWDVPQQGKSSYPGILNCPSSLSSSSSPSLAQKLT